MARVVLTAGLGYGDEGKGTTVDFLTRHLRASLVVRFNGGAQAAHNVITPEGKHHTFAQFGSGTFAGARTFLSHFMLVNPINFLNEAAGLEDKGLTNPASQVFVDENALITTPYHMAMNWLREFKRKNKHGSTGLGIGETVQDAKETQLSYINGSDMIFRVRDLQNRRKMTEKLEETHWRLAQRAYRAELAPPEGTDEVIRRKWELLTSPETPLVFIELYEEFAKKVNIVRSEWLNDQLDKGGEAIFEAAQGVLLDQDYGFQPHTTWSDTTYRNAEALLDFFSGDITKLGIVRAYMTRHGAGPFVTENKDFRKCSLHDHNKWGLYQGSFRSGAFDLVATKYAIEVLGGIDGLVVTNNDRLDYTRPVPMCEAYMTSDYRMSKLPVKRPTTYTFQEELGKLLAACKPVYSKMEFDAPAYSSHLAARLDVPLALASFGPTALDKQLYGAVV